MHLPSTQPASMDHINQSYISPRLLEERFQDHEGPVGDLGGGAGLPRRAPADGGDERLRNIFERIAAFCPRHHNISFPKILLIKGEETANPRAVVVDEALWIAVTLIVGGTLEQNFTTGSCPMAISAPPLKFLDDRFLPKCNQPCSTELSKDRRNDLPECIHRRQCSSGTSSLPINPADDPADMRWMNAKLPPNLSLGNLS